jgi:hypothetical protein
MGSFLIQYKNTTQLTKVINWKAFAKENPEYKIEVIIDLSSTDKIKLNDKLGSMNFLSWPFSMSIKGTMLYNFISSIIVMILFLAIRNSTDNYVLTLIVIFVAFWNLYWLIYYLIKSENFKNEIKTLIRWKNDLLVHYKVHEPFLNIK